VIVDDEKVKREENIWIITRGQGMGSRPLVSNETQLGIALHAGGGKVP
jgi:hypothetical protein